MTHAISSIIWPATSPTTPPMPAGPDFVDNDPDPAYRLLNTTRAPQAI
jgi:hypothetical protein